MQVDPLPSSVQSRLPYIVRLCWAIFFAGTLAFTVRTIWEETVWTWERGPQMVGFSLIHGPGAILLLFYFLLMAWVIGVAAATVWGLYQRHKISIARWAALGASILLFVAQDLGDDFWQRLFIKRMSASPHAETLMIYAAYRGGNSTVKSYLAHGVKIGAVARHDWRTAVHAAAVKGNVELIRFLAAQGADVNALDRSGDSPLELAFEHRHEDAARALESLGAKRIRGDEAQRDKAMRDQVHETITGLTGAP